MAPRHTGIRGHRESRGQGDRDFLGGTGRPPGRNRAEQGAQGPRPQADRSEQAARRHVQTLPLCPKRSNPAPSLGPGINRSEQLAGPSNAAPQSTAMTPPGPRQAKGAHLSLGIHPGCDLPQGIQGLHTSDSCGPSGTLPLPRC